VNYLYHLIILFEIYALTALSLNLMMGYTGLVSLAHAGYFAIGAYTYSILTLIFGCDFIPALFGAAFVSVMLSSFMSLPSWRLRGDYFVLITIAVQSFIFSILYNWSDTESNFGSFLNLTNGSAGIMGIPRPDIFSISFDTLGDSLLLYTAITLLFMWAYRRLMHSPYGRLLKAIRDDELTARSLGKNSRFIKMQVIAVSCVYISIAGSIYASYIGYIDPGIANLDHSILVLSMVLIGGLGNFRGPIIGALILILLPEILRQLPFPTHLAANIRLLAYGLLILLMIHFRPQGLAGEYKVE
jgi:branched-chain amino acid transport system permease protein